MCRRWRFRLRRALGISPATTLNIYTCRFIDPALLGDATWPWRSAESDLLHGVAIHFATLPGGAMETYNLGDNAVHEVLKQLTFKDVHPFVRLRIRFAHLASGTHFSKLPITHQV